MPEFGVEVKGWKETEQKLRRVKGEIPLEVQQELKAAGQTVYFQLREYPPPRPGQQYVRTYTYRNSISTEIETADDVVFLNVKQGAPYSKYIRGGQGREYGAWMHRGRWVQLKDIVANFTGEVERRLKEAVQRVIDRAGLGK